MSRVGDIIDRVAMREGGYVDHPQDRGGPTNYGVTLRTLAEARDRPVTADDVKALRYEEAKAVLMQLYVLRPGLDRIRDDRLLELVVDCAVHHGQTDAVRFLQRAVGVSDDGILGPETLRALEGLDATKVGLRVCANRARHFGKAITRRPANAAFAHGWMNRLALDIETLAT